ncbi:hypothetical protein DSM104299_04147 [Baekduia alba]|uniref:hypothetical protein n=1 Tax=Baekduia alba TaxID=2997333 RepID=UPI00234279FE|nr:hypothetical protein [Baekduia alba]WCB95404.1 hypothetical protein DSM104299_04147 [Baekduia alba]
MDETRTRDHIQQHADAVLRGDMEAVLADFSQELRPRFPELAKGLPQPVTAARVLTLDVGDQKSVAVIGDGGTTAKSRSGPTGATSADSPVIVHAEPAT